MGIKAVLDSLDGVDAPDLYAQAEDGKYYLDVDGVDNLPAVQGLTTTLKKYKEAAPSAHGLKQKLERLNELEGFGALEMSADDVRERLQRLEEMEASGGDGADEKVEALRETYERQKDALRKQLEAKLGEKDTEVQTLQSFVERLTVDNELERALDKVEVLPGTREAVKALLKERKPMVVRDGENYRGIFETDLGELPIADYVEAWSKRDEAAPFMPASGNQGSGAGGGKGGSGGPSRANPWNPDSRNVTRQMALTNPKSPDYNPRLARQMAAEYGVALNIKDAA